MKHPITTLMKLQEQGAMSPAEAARHLTGKTNARTSAYAKFWLRHVEAVSRERIKQLTKNQ